VAEPPVARIEPGALRGRVLVDGTPVPHFGVILSVNYMTSYQSEPYVVRSVDGRFSIDGIAARTWDILVVAPGIGTLIVPSRDVSRGAVLDLGDLAITRGHTIIGRITDATGQPITRATVRIISSTGLPADAITEMSNGNYETQTDASGRYRFAGVSVSALRHSSPRLVATYGRTKSSDEVRIASADATIDLVVRDAGVIDGEVEGDFVDATVTADETSRHGYTRYARVKADRTFQFDNLPPGTYEVQLGAGHTAVPLPITLSIAPQQRANLRFVPPSQTVSVEVMAGADCRFATLTPHSTSLLTRPIAMASCAGSSATLDGVAPGRYRACIATDCMTIDVAISPELQTFELVP
jgi:hypothetical protein